VIEWPDAKHEPHDDELCNSHGVQGCECMCTECMSAWSSCICAGCDCDI